MLIFHVNCGLPWNLLYEFGDMSNVLVPNDYTLSAFEKVTLRQICIFNNYNDICH